MKKKIALALVAAMTICMVGCGSETAAVEEAPAEETAAEEDTEVAEETAEETTEESADTEGGKTYIISYSPFYCYIFKVIIFNHICIACTNIYTRKYTNHS